MTHTKDNICLVPVCHDAVNVTVCNDPDGGEYLYWQEPELYINADKNLPPGSWRFVCLSTEMTEEKAGEVLGSVEMVGQVFYPDYLNNDCFLTSWEDAWSYLLTALGCDPAGTYAVLINDKK